MNSFLPINSYQVEMTVIQGRGLAAKDRHFLTRQRTTSDPYVVALLGLDQRLGQTKTCRKTLDPVWSAKFNFSVPNKKHVKVPTDMSAFLQQSEQEEQSSTIDACAMVLLKLYDEDHMTDDDMMGTLVIPIPAAPRSGLVTRKWYAVDNLFVPNAVGEVEVELQITPEFQKTTMRDLFPSPETIAKWSVCILGKEQKVNDHNVVMENQDRKSYIMTVFKEFSK
jgi:Ca2+-dependent lipid-binding protein